MKRFLNTILLLNLLFVILCADNPDFNVFVGPIAIFVIAGFFRIYHKEFVEFLTEKR